MGRFETAIEDALNSLSSAQAAVRSASFQTLRHIAEEEYRSAFADPTSGRNLLERWYGAKPGYFWNAWDRIEGQDKSILAWSTPWLREIIFLPVGRLIYLGVLATTPGRVEEIFAEFREFFSTQLSACSNLEKVLFVEKSWLGREGILLRVSKKWLGCRDITRELKQTIGQNYEKLKAEVNNSIETRRAELEPALEQTGLAGSAIDLSLPGVPRVVGTRHPITQTFEELEKIFLSIGFTIVEGPEIETPYYNFEALNIPEHHPARDTMDTFYLDLPPLGKTPAPGLLLRTHTSPVQARTMERQQPPVRIVVPGKVFRRDNPDATHSFMFHQIECLAVDTDITFCDFKGTVDYFVRAFFGPKVKTRLRPSYFPFTEPSAEVDATCHICGGKGCRICKFSGWIELFGAGMVDPAVYGFAGYDEKKYSGFAFGMGVDRFAFLKYGIDDLQLFFQNDVRFLRQFR